jgi:hypothetical protein
MQTYDLTVAAGGVVQIGVSGRYMRLINASAVVTVGFWAKGNLKGKAVGINPGLWIKPEESFDSITVESATAQTVSIMVGAGEAGYDQVTVSGSVLAALSNTITDAAPVSVGTSATLLIAAATTRRGIRFTNAGTADVYLGSSGITTANGAIKIAAGNTWIEDEAPGAAWYGISGTAAQSVRMQVLS